MSKLKNNIDDQATKKSVEYPELDRELVRELARCFARAAVDEHLEKQKQPGVSP